MPQRAVALAAATAHAAATFRVADAAPNATAAAALAAAALAAATAHAAATFRVADAAPNATAAAALAAAALAAAAIAAIARSAAVAAAIPAVAAARPLCGHAVHQQQLGRPLQGQAQDPGAPCAPAGHSESADHVPARSTSQECSPFRDAMCLTIDKPFFVAFICGQCLDNVHGKADWRSCFEVGGSNMTTDAP